jgi:putative aldouronate transport system substrate-binding protein
MKGIQRVAAAMVGLMLAISSISGCSGKSASTDNAAATTASGGNLDGGVTKATGLPIVEKPITLKVYAWYYSGFVEDMTKNKTLQDIQKATGINLEFTMFSDQEKVNLMYASRQYPDIAWRMDAKNVNVRTDAVDAGDVYSIDDFMKYAPNYQKMFSENPDIKLQSTYKDGKMYSFPYVNLDETAYNLRDQWFINKQWLDELKLQMPKTTDDFLNVMRAFRDNAGKGSIPSKVIPYYFMFNSNVGGQFDIMGTFGVYCPNGSYYIVDKANNNKISSQAVNPKIKAPLKYLATMYKEGLIKPQAFTDDWAAYTAAIGSEPAVVGSFGAFQSANITANGKWYYPMAPVTSPSGDQPYIRAQVKGSTFPWNFMIFKNNKYPVASARLADYMGSPDVSINLEKGYKDAAWKMGADGKPELIPNAKLTDDNKKQIGNESIGNDAVLILTDKMFTDPSRKIEGTRGWAYDNIYKNFTPKTQLNPPNLPSGLLDEKDLTRATDLNKQIEDEIKVTFASWITGKGDIDAEWDAYVTRMNKLGLQEYLQLKQKELDNAAKLTKK